MKRLLVIALLVILTLTVTSTAFAVTGGQPDGNGHPYVGVMLYPEYTGTGSYSLCSGTFISPTKFVTAAHCAPDNSRVSLYIPGVALVSANYDANDGYCAACGNGAPGFDTHDVAVATADSGVALPRYGNLPSVNQVDSLGMNTPIDLVGFGVSQRIHVPGEGAPDWAGIDLVRRYAPTELVASNHVNADEYIKLRANHSQGSGGICFGDSGGPNLLGGTDTILAVNSYVNNYQCAGVTYSNRIDSAEILNWINSH